MEFLSIRHWLAGLRRLGGMNWTMFLATFALLLIGIFFVYSAANLTDDRHEKQILWVFIGFLTYAAFAVGDYRKLSRWGWLCYGVSVILLTYVLLFGVKVYGARRWIDIPGVFRLQPSELAKISIILLLAQLLNRPAGELGRLSTVLGILGIVAAPVFLIMVEPDFGTALIFLPVTFVMMYVAGVPRRTILGMLGTGVLVVGVFLGALFVPELAGAKEETQVKIRKVLHLKEYHKDRIKVFLGIDSDPLGAGWNKVQSEIAVGSGGFLGKGYMCGTQNMLGFLPRSVTPTDFIFSVIAEEKGFVGSMVVLLLFAAILITGTYAAVTVRDKFGRLLCTGIVGMIFVHVFINVAMTVGMMPIIGVPLPLVSYGGSFTVVMMAVIGIMQSVYIRSRPSTGSYSL